MSRARSAEGASEPIARFAFDGSADDDTGTHVGRWITGRSEYTKGLDGRALSLGSDGALAIRTSAGDELSLRSSEDFSVQFWTRTVQDSDTRFVLVSQKGFADNSVAAQKEAGWVFYVSGGTWAWNMGSGDRRITYERENGQHMPLNDGRWHQLTMTYSSDQSEIRLFYDGENRVTYHVSDGEGFDFTSANPLVIGWNEGRNEPLPAVLPSIELGAEQLQRYVDTFNGLGLAEVAADEFAGLIVDPRGLFERKVAEHAARLDDADRATFLRSMSSVDFEPIEELESALMNNPYTVHQVMNFMETAPLLEIYSLIDGTVTISRSGALDYAVRERLDRPDFDIDNLEIWDRVLSAEEVVSAYAEYFLAASHGLSNELSSITTAAWNIWHGGKHFTVDEHGWDSRLAIAQLLDREGVDIVMMQETYSAGDFIAAELGYYFATSVDWDYLNQGSNVSVLSRYPIKELHVQDDSPFMNVGTRIAISESQDLYAMSNWYGMNQFPAVFAFHESRFQKSDSVPTIFAGDFNAVPHTDGGDSPASRALLDAGFTDAFRSLHPDVEADPGFTHRSGRRIDQLYYKGSGLENTSTRLISTWPTGFPSDHYMIRATFELDYSTKGAGR
jgi:endonuclease/exonuclease/phosphatase family metal-dependent hydrolase